MASIKRETSRVSVPKKGNVAGGARPSLFERTRQSMYGSHRIGKVTSNASSLLADQAGTHNLKSFSGVFPIPESECESGTPPKLNADQEEKYEEMLEYFRHQKDFPVSLQVQNNNREPPTEWEKLRMLSRESMLRYLRATKWDVTAAKKRLTDTIAWRREFGVDDLDPDEMAKEAQSGKETVLGYDNRSRPLHYMHPHRNDTKESPRQMQFAVWILERCIDLMPPGVEQLALLINFDHKSRNPTSIANAKLMLYILQNHYVERLGIALCINVPWVFKLFWNAIQPFIDPVTKSKCKFDEAIKTEVPVSQLSAEFGGELDAKYNHDLYWPDLVRLSAERRKQMVRRFKDDCNSEIGASEWIIRGGDDESSPFNAKDKAAPSEMTTTSKSSEMPPLSEDGKIGEKARVAAVAACDKRAESAVISPTLEQSSTLEKYATPSETIASNPLERKFSTASSAGGISALPERSATPKLETTTEQPREEEHEEKRHSKSASEGWHHFEEEVAKGFKGFNQRIASLAHPRNSREGRRSRDSSVDHTKQDKVMDAEKDRKENVETDSNPTVNGKELPSAAEATVVAGTAGVVGAASAIGLDAKEKVAEKVNETTSTESSAKKANTVHVLFFAAAKEAAGGGRQEVTLPELPFPLSKFGSHLIQLVSESEKGDPKALEKVIDRSKWSVDEDMIEEADLASTMLKGGEDVAIIPPVSGG